MALPYLSVVRLVSDEHREEGVAAGAVGTIVDVYEDGVYEVEFSDPEGMTIALLTLRGDALELVAEPAAIAVTRSSR